MTISKMYGTAVKKIYFNEDNQHFYHFHPESDMTPEGVRNLVDTYAQTGTVRGILFCTNMQRALYDSAVWERFKDVEQNIPYVNHLRLLSERGVDQFKIWLQRCGELDIEGWLSMRMNDSHGLKEAAEQLYSDHQPWPSRKWKENPQWRRAPYRSERSWEGSYNYSIPEVREHHLNLVRELFNKYDMFGFECDWMRWGMMFAPGFERDGQKILTDFVQEIRNIADAAENRVGHKIRLAHRVPSHPESCLNYGFDLIEWGKNGCVDMLTLSGFLEGTNFDPQVKLWRKLLPENTIINVVAESACAAYPGNSLHSYDILRGAAAAAWSSGADNLYLFNECYRESENLKALNEMMLTIADEEKLSRSSRRMAVSFPQAIIPGESARTVLPVKLTVPHIGVDMGRMEQNITLRMPAGKLSAETKAVLSLGFSDDTERERLTGLPVRCNTVSLTFIESLELPPDRIDQNNIFQLFSDYPRDAVYVMRYAVPAKLLKETFNAFEILPPKIKGSIVWASLELDS